MLTLDTARALAASGILWEPQAGDRFAITQQELAGEVYWISELTIEVHHYEDQTILGFNGTTEWALDSIDHTRVLWLPREDQLRDALGERFESLTMVGGGYAVTLADGSRHLDIDAERAYARAVLQVLGAS